MLEDQTAISFLMAPKRFVATHNAVEKIFTDNALYLGKAVKVLKCLWSNLKDETVQNYFGRMGKTWSFNPPRVSWYGGHFERLVGIMKTCLQNSMKQRKLELKEFITVLKLIEAIMNSRPLTVISNTDETP